MQYFDGEIEKLIRADLIDMEVGMSYSTNPNNLRLQLADLIEERRAKEREAARAAAVGSATPLATSIDPSDIIR